MDISAAASMLNRSIIVLSRLVHQIVENASLTPTEIKEKAVKQQMESRDIKFINASKKAMHKHSLFTIDII